jgi:hypothetical protein
MELSVWIITLITYQVLFIRQTPGEKGVIRIYEAHFSGFSELKIRVRHSSSFYIIFL